MSARKIADSLPITRNTTGLRKGGGRPKGVPNVASREIKDAARLLVSDEAYVESLRKRLPAGKAPHMETLLHHYAYGKPKETVDVTASVAASVRIVNEYHKSSSGATAE